MGVPLQSERLRQGLQGLRDGFLERLMARCLAIEGILAAAADTDADLVSEADRDAIRSHAHKTAGVAATFGYGELGERALSVERLMSQHDADMPWSVVRPEIEALLDEMEDALDAFG